MTTKICFSDITAEKLFDGDFLFEIPFYQRAYIWDTSLWSRLLKDMELISGSQDIKEHFMGFITLKRNERDDESPFIIVDGQQRLTTFILFARAYYAIKKNKKNKIIFFKKNKPTFRHNHHDKEIFENILSHPDLTDADKEEFSDSKVLQCFDYYFEEEKERVKKIKFDRVFKKLSFAYIILPEKYDEQEIFDTMNSLLVRLNPAELLKNYFFNPTSGLENAEQLYKDTWRKIFEENQEIKKYWDHFITTGRNKQTNLEMLLRSYLEIYETREKIKYPKKSEYKKHDSLFDRYKYILDGHVKDRKKFMLEIIRYAKIYKKHINHEYRKHLIDIESQTQRLNAIIFSLQTTTIIPYMLYILGTVNDSQEIENIFYTLESYLVRRFICGFTHKNYNKYFTRAIKGRRNSYDELKEIIYGDIVAEDTKMPTNKLLKEHFEIKLFKNNAQARTILHLLEHYTTPKNTANPPLSLKNASLEHVMPKGWRKNWPIKSEWKDDITIERDKRKFWLGNMILIREELNNYFGDASWEDKKEGIEEKNRKHKALEKKLNKKIDIESLKTCCQNIVTFEKYLKDESGGWNEETIKQRNGELYELAKDLWSYELSD